VEVLFEAAGWGENVSLEAVWEAIDNAVGSRARLRAAVEGVQEFIPPPGADPDGQWRAAVVERYATVRGFVKMLCRVIEFEATAGAQKVLTAMRDLRCAHRGPGRDRPGADVGRRDGRRGGRNALSVSILRLCRSSGGS